MCLRYGEQSGRGCLQTTAVVVIVGIAIESNSNLKRTRRRRSGASGFTWLVGAF